LSTAPVVYCPLVSFDLYFVTLGLGETWQDAMDRMEASAGDERALDEQELARWDAILDQVRPLLPDAEEFTGESHRELSDDASGMQLTLSPGELSLTVPYWYSGPDAQAMVDRLRSVAVAVENATGLTAYDPQADAAFIDGGYPSAATAFDQVEAALRGGAAAAERDEPADAPGGWRRLFRKGG
jgi:hypothetical protein